MDGEGPDAARREAELEHGRYLARRAVAQEQLAQIKEHKHQADLAKLEDKREGEQIQRLNQLYQLEIQGRMEKEQEEKVERQRLYHEYVAEQKKMKAEEKQKDDEDDDRIKAYIKGKEMMADLTREKNAETNRLVQEHKDKAFEQLTAQMDEACKIEDDRLARGAAEVEDEYQMKNKEKEKKKKAAIESIAEHRVTVMKLKVEKEREEKAEGKRERHALMEKNRISLEMEKAKKQSQRDANMEVQKIQIQQMVTKEQQLMLMCTQLFNVPFLWGRGEKWEGMIFDKYQLTSLLFIRLKSRQKNSRKSKQIWTMILREKLLSVRIERFSDKNKMYLTTTEVSAKEEEASQCLLTSYMCLQKPISAQQLKLTLEQVTRRAICQNLPMLSFSSRNKYHSYSHGLQLYQ